MMIKFKTVKNFTISMIKLDTIGDNKKQFEVAVIYNGKFVYRVQSFTRKEANVDFEQFVKWFC